MAPEVGLRSVNKHKAAAEEEAAEEVQHAVVVLMKAKPCSVHLRAGHVVAGVDDFTVSDRHSNSLLRKHFCTIKSCLQNMMYNSVSLPDMWTNENRAAPISSMSTNLILYPPHLYLTLSLHTSLILPLSQTTKGFEHQG